MQDAEPIARARLKAQLFASRGQAQMQHHMRLHGRDQICGPPLGALIDNRQDSRVDLDAQAREPAPVASLHAAGDGHRRVHRRAGKGSKGREEHAQDWHVAFLARKAPLVPFSTRSRSIGKVVRFNVACSINPLSILAALSMGLRTRLVDRSRRVTPAPMTRCAPPSIASRRRAFAAVVALSLAPGLSGCASVGLSAMSATAPAGFSARKEPLIIPLFVASTRRDDRARTPGYDTPKSNAHFTFETISVPPAHKPGQIELPSWGKANAREHFVVTQTSPVEVDNFTSQIATHLSGRVGSNRDVLVFVHGFNTTLDEARFRLAQLTADGRFGGVPVLFTWPSTSSVLSYVSARENATISRDALSKLLTDISRTPGVGRIHLLAHSMGGWLTMEALRETSIGGQRHLDGKLGNVMLAAPDIDLSVFRQQMQRIGSGANIAVFSSTGDRALSLSSTITGDRTRLGAIDPANARDRAELAKLGVKVYDLSSISDGWINHGAYASAPDVVRQIGAQLTRPRQDDSQTTSVIDAGVEQSRPQTTAIDAKPLDALPTPAQ